MNSSGSHDLETDPLNSEQGTSTRLPKIFFSLRFSANSEAVQRQIQEFSDTFKCKHTELRFLPVFGVYQEKGDWKSLVEQQIQQCDGFVCFIIMDTLNSENINWEIKTAFKHNKPVIFTGDANIGQSPIQWQHMKIVPFTFDELAVALLPALLPAAILRHPLNQVSSSDSESLMSQYGIMVNSWESLVNRRQNVNSFYSAVIAGLLGGIGACLVNSREMGSQTAVVGAALSVLGMFLSVVWRQMLTQYGTASTAKSDIVQSLEKHLPARLFELEWKAMKMRSYVSTTQKDANTANVFIAAFVLSLVLAVAVALKWIPLE